MARNQLQRWGIRAGLIVAVALVAVGCGSDSADGDTAANDVDLSALEEHMQLSRDAGCVGCHTVDGKSSYGPTWLGLYGSEITLEDGTTQIADEDYIRTAIADPAAERRDGVSGTMPQNRLNDEEINTLIELIQALGVAVDAES